MRKKNNILKDQRVGKKGRNSRTTKNKNSKNSGKSVLSVNIMRIAVILFSIFRITVVLMEYAVDLASLGKPKFFVEGNHILEKQKIIKIAGVEDTNFIFLNPRSVVRELSRIPWIKTVSVRKKLPTSIYIHIEERTPFAWLDNNGLKLIDDNGVILDPKGGINSEEKEVINGVYADHNYLSGEKVREEDLYEAIALIKDIKSFAPWFYENISSVNISNEDNVTFELRQEQCKVFLGKDKVHQKMENLKKVFSTLEESEFQGIDVFDLRFKDRVVVRKKTQNIVAGGNNLT